MPTFFEKLRAWSFKRQCLDQQESDAGTVLERIVGVYSSHPSAPLSLHARLRSFSPKSFHNLESERRVCRIPAMRLSAFLVPCKTAPLVFTATVPPANDPIWEKRYSQKGRSIPPDKYPDWKKQILTNTQEPKSSKDLKSLIRIPDSVIKPVLNRMTFEGELLRIGGESLRANRISYVSTTAWLREPLADANREESQHWLAQNYFHAFGPARIKDFQWWSGLTTEECKTAIEQLETEKLDDDYFILEKDLGAFERMQKSQLESLNILPQWDCYTMAFAPDGRERLIEKDHIEKLYGSLGATGGNALPCILVNGQVCGIWQANFRKNVMIATVEFFKVEDSSLQEKLNSNFQKVAHFLGAEQVKIDFTLAG